MKTIFYILLIFYFENIYSQDIHFSQFWEPSAFINPTHIGNFDGNLKLSAQYRNQWGQFNTPLTTVFADATLKLEQEKNYWAFSMSFLRDQLSYLSYHQLRMAGSVSYQKKLSRKVFLGIGTQIGTRLTNVNYSKLTFDRQWDPNSGQFQHNNPSFENFNVDNVYSPFFGLGTSLNYQQKKILHTFDVAATYIFPNQGNDVVFYQPMKFAVNYHTYIQLGKKVVIMPKLGLITTASANSVNTGVVSKFSLNDDNDIYGGMLYRWGIDRNADGLYPVVGARHKKLRIGFSYDIVTSGLNQEGFKSAYELTVSYIIKPAKHKYYSIDCLRL